MNTHKFDVADAKKHGIEKAILLEHLKFHQEANQGNPDMMFDGKTHAFIKKDTIDKMYPYMKYDSVRKWLRELEEEGVIVSCKPFSKKGYHLKYYHVLGIGLKSQSNETLDHSMNGTTSHSSISYQVNNLMKGSIVERIRSANTKRELLTIWKSYRKEKNKHMGLYEEDVLINSTWENKPIPKIKESILYTIENGWLTLQIPESEEESTFDPEKAKAIRGAFLGT